MKHPLHGFTHANSVQEIEKMKSNGWEPEEPETVVHEQPVTLAKGRGRPPKEHK
jgi:hypothetical protein